jgi:RNA polymerase sigma-70 factor, ECF subfamily
VLREDTRARARAGDEEAFRELVDPFRAELQLHCYRILGSLQDAEDQLQETLLAAWRGLDSFEERASLRAWLYRIATNRCLNALRGRRRRAQEVRMVDPPEPTRRAEPLWLDPYPDVLLEGLADTAPGPDARYETSESVALAFVALPPRQRAVLVLRDVLGFHTAEVAELLDSSEASVKAALQRARATLDERVPDGSRERAPLPSSARERELLGGFAAAVERGDIEGMVSLLTDDAWVTMPPEPYEYQGRQAIAGFLQDATPGAERTSDSSPRVPAANPPSPATCPTPRPPSRAPTRYSCSRSRATASRPSPGSASAASSPTSDRGVLSRAHATRPGYTDAPCVLASERASHPDDERHSAKPS